MMGSEDSVNAFLTTCTWAEHLRDKAGGRHCSSLLGGKKQRERQKGVRDKILQGPVPSDLLPPAMSHLLKFPETSQIVPPSVNQVFKTWTGKGHFIFKL
jgi:hypothetical protein